jgi:hypothetical protein
VMSDMVVVYESNEPFWAEELMKALQEEGFHPELADDAGTAYHSMDNKNPGVLGMPQGRMKVSVVVPSQEEVAARLFLQKRDERSGSSVAKLTGRLRKPLILSALTAVVTFIIMVCLYNGLSLGLGRAGEYSGDCIAVCLSCVLHSHIKHAFN